MRYFIRAKFVARIFLLALKPSNLTAIFEANGTYVQTEVEIAVSSLPEAVNQYVTKNLKGEKIKEAAKDNRCKRHYCL